MEMISQVVTAFSMTLVVLALPASGQPALPCTPAMLNSFTPCMNFLNNATAPPTPDCCNSLKSLTTNSSGCLCPLVTGSVPLPVPVNRTLAISLPQACNMPGVAVQCKAAATASAPAPGPASLALSPSPAAAAAAAASPASPSAPESDTPKTVPGPASGTTTPTPAGSGGAAAIPSASASFPLLVVLGLGPLLVMYS